MAVQHHGLTQALAPLIMQTPKFLNSTARDMWWRAKGFNLYLLVLIASFTLLLLAKPPSLFSLPLFSGPNGAHTEIASALSWSFVISYPLFHMAMRARLLDGSDRPNARFILLMIGAFTLLFLAWLSQQDVPLTPTSRRARLLTSHFGALTIGLMASMSTAIGLFCTLNALLPARKSGL